MVVQRVEEFLMLKVLSRTTDGRCEARKIFSVNPHVNEGETKFPDSIGFPHKNMYISRTCHKPLHRIHWWFLLFLLSGFFEGFLFFPFRNNWGLTCFCLIQKQPPPSPTNLASRKGKAEMQLGRAIDAAHSFHQGLQLAPDHPVSR